MIADGLILLLEMQLALAAGICIALFLRQPIRKRFGAEAAYRLWILVPVLVLAIMIPARTILKEVTQTDFYSTFTETVPKQALPAAEVFVQAPIIDHSAPIIQAAEPAAEWPLETILAMLGLVWACGVAINVGILLRRQQRYEIALGNPTSLSDHQPDVLRAARSDIGPALVGLRNPRIVVPSDFNNRFNQDERILILAHEKVHLRRGDAQANGLAAALCCFGWFNPLVHRGTALFRLDQELACDAKVIRQYPSQLKAYGEAMLKTQIAGPTMPLGCHWRSENPIKERIMMLTQIPPSKAQRILGTILLSGTIIGTGTLAWASQPATIVEVTEEADTTSDEDFAGLTIQADAKLDVKLLEQKLERALHETMQHEAEKMPINHKVEHAVTLKAEKDVTPQQQTAPTSSPAKGSVLINETYNIDGVHIKNAIAVVKIVPERRNDYAITINGNEAPTIRRKQGNMIVDGGLPNNHKKCNRIDANDVMKKSNGLFITIRMPRDGDVSVGGIAFSEVTGKTKGADLSFHGCGNAVIASTSGALDLSIHGAVDGKFDQVDGPLDLSLHGSANASGGNVEGPADVSVHGSADLALGNINGMADISVHGSAELALGNINGVADISVHGSGSVQLGDIGDTLDASVHGSGDLAAKSVNGATDASIHGSGKLNIGNQNGSVDADLNGAARLGIKSITAKLADISAGGASSIQIGKGTIDNLSIDVNGASKARFEGSAKKARVKSDRASKVFIHTVDELYIDSKGSDKNAQISTSTGTRRASN